MEKTENEFFERAKKNATFVFDTAKEYRKARIVSSMDYRGPQQIANELQRDLHNIDVFQTYFEIWYGDYGKYQYFTIIRYCKFKVS